MTLMEQVERYVALKKALGFKFLGQERLLRGYATYADGLGDQFVVGTRVMDWALKTASPQWAQRKLRIVGDFAAYLQAEDERHEIPHSNYFGVRETRHKPSNLLPPEQIRRVMEAALQLGPAGSITPLTFHCILRLLASTGMRRSEATNLLLTDITPDGLLVRNTKFGKNRLVPLDVSVWDALDEYLVIRKRSGGPDEHLFVVSTGNPVHPIYLTHIFIQLARKVGVRGEPGTPGPKLRDLRHGFAIRALESIDITDRKDVGRHMLALSTYLGHTNIEDSYWYLDATPLLFRKISEATEQLHAGGGWDHD